MTKINEVIPPMPDAPDSTTDTKTEFNVKSDTFVKAWTPHTVSINTWATEANAVATEINNVVASLPTGTIDDVNLSTTNAFSNQYVHDTYMPKSDYVMSPELQSHLVAGGSMPTWNGIDYIGDTARFGTMVSTATNWRIYPDGKVTIGTLIASSPNTSLQEFYPDGTTKVIGYYAAFIEVKNPYQGIYIASVDLFYQVEVTGTKSCVATINKANGGLATVRTTITYDDKVLLSISEPVSRPNASYRFSIQLQGKWK